MYLYVLLHLIYFSGISMFFCTFPSINFRGTSSFHFCGTCYVHPFQSQFLYLESSSNVLFQFVIFSPLQLKTINTLVVSLAVVRQVLLVVNGIPTEANGNALPQHALLYCDCPTPSLALNRQHRGHRSTS